jgi:hypothetical protein
MTYALLKPEEIVKMYHSTKLPLFIKSIVLLTGLLAATGAVAATPIFDNTCASDCHGAGNTGTNIEGVVIPPVQDGSLAGIKNSITPVPVSGHIFLQIQYDLGGLTNEQLAAISAELNPPSGCTPPQTLVNGVCTIPTPTACDNSANTTLCINQQHQLGSLGSAGTTAAKADIYKVSCAKPAVAISVAVSGLTAENPAKISIQASKGGVISRAITDKTNGDGIASKSVKLAKGSGVYKVMVSKAKGTPGIVQYDATINCLSKKQAQVGNNVVIKKNQ